MARSFNGTTGKIVAASVTPTNFDYNSPFSVFGWACLVDVSYNSLVGHLDPSAGYKGWEITRSTSVGGVPEFFLVNTYSSKTLQAQGSTSGLASWGSAFNNVWVSFGVTYNGNMSTTGVVFYLNGSIETTWPTFNTLGNNTPTNTIPLYFGQRTDGTIPIANGGKLADVAIWSAVLTAGEMAALSKGRRPYMVRPLNLVSYWPLDGLQSPEPDLSGNANNGTLTGTALASGPPVTMFTRKWPRNYDAAATAAAGLAQSHFRFRTDTGAVDATPTWGDAEDAA